MESNPASKATMGRYHPLMRVCIPCKGLIVWGDFFLADPTQVSHSGQPTGGPLRTVLATARVAAQSPMDIFMGGHMRIITTVGRAAPPTQPPRHPPAHGLAGCVVGRISTITPFTLESIIGVVGSLGIKIVELSEYLQMIASLMITCSLI